MIQIKYPLFRLSRRLSLLLNRYNIHASVCIVSSLILAVIFFSQTRVSSSKPAEDTMNILRRSVYANMVNFDLGKETIKEVFLSSSYFYPTSKSLGDNSIAIVLTGSRLLLYEYTTLTFLAFNGTDNIVSTVQTELVTPEIPCPWIDVFATTTLLENVTSISVLLGNRFERIPFQTPKTKAHDVVTCISPVFANEQWQYLVFAAHIYRVFGSHMHLYIRSMVGPVYDLMKAYEKEGYMTLQPWVRLGMPSVPMGILEPNRMVAFRNQEAAQTDCLLQYKETAKFITFMDLDDILIPRLGSSYLEEFEHFFHMNPAIGLINYEKQNVRLRGNKASSDFTLTEMFASIRYTGLTEVGKSVMRPSTFNSTWIHYPLSIPKHIIKYEVPAELNSITHLKEFELTTGKSTNTIEEPLYEATTTSKKNSEKLIRKSSIETIHLDFERMTQTAAVKKIIRKLPQEWYYFDLISACYKEKFYKLFDGNKKKEIGCVGPDSCELPAQAGTLCVNARATYSSSKRGEFYSIHHFRNTSFSRDMECVK